MDELLKEVGVTGAVWARLDNDGEIHVDAAGVNSVATGEPLAADSKMHVGSIAKTLIATGVLKLVSEGRIDLNAPISDYLPALPFDNPWTGHPIRVRQLLDHTAGLDDMRLWQLFSTQATPNTALIEAFTRAPSVRVLRSQPGSRFSYSNMGYTLAAMLIETVCSERYELWLDRELLRPSGMHDSTFAFTTQLGDAADPRLAWGHHDTATTAPAMSVYLRPAGQFTTTARDLALFAQFLMSDGQVAGRSLVKPELLREMGRVHDTDAARAGLKVGYALGLERRDRHGALGLCHGGDVVGFHARLCIFPAPLDANSAAIRPSKAFVLLLNTDCNGRDCGRFDALLVQALAMSPLTPPSRAAASREVGEWQGRYVPAPNRMASFRYLDFLFDSRRLQWDGKLLQLAPIQGVVRTLMPVGDLTFIADGRSAASHVLLQGDNGQRFYSDGLRSYRKFHPAYYWLLAASLAGGLIGLLWFALVAPVRAVVRRESIIAPGVIGAWQLLLPLPLFLLQSYTQLGDRTAASVALYVVTATLPLLMLWQAWRSLRCECGIACARINLVAALLVLQWCAVLAVWRLLPFALWR